MAQSKMFDGPTPKGGVKAEFFFMNEKNEAADESVATRIEIVEYDQSGKAIFRTYAMKTNNG